MPCSDNWENVCLGLENCLNAALYQPLNVRGQYVSSFTQPCVILAPSVSWFSSNRRRSAGKDLFRRVQNFSSDLPRESCTAAWPYSASGYEWCDYVPDLYWLHLYFSAQNTASDCVAYCFSIKRSLGVSYKMNENSRFIASSIWSPRIFFRFETQLYINS